MFCTYNCNNKDLPKKISNEIIRSSDLANKNLEPINYEPYNSLEKALKDPLNFLYQIWGSLQ